jgi:hypothetical protein
MYLSLRGDFPDQDSKLNSVLQYTLPLEKDTLPKKSRALEKSSCPLTLEKSREVGTSGVTVPLIGMKLRKSRALPRNKAMASIASTRGHPGG